MGIKLIIEPPVSEEDIADARDVLEALALSASDAPQAQYIPCATPEPIVVDVAPAPVAPAPVAPAPAPAPPVSVVPAPPVELDSAGYPHDLRIHQKAKGKIKKTGKWKLRRGVSATEVQKVRDEVDALREPPALVPAPPVTPVAPAPSVAPAPPVTPVAPAPSVAPAPEPKLTESEIESGSAIPGVTLPPALDYNGFIASVSERIMAGQLTKEQVAQACRLHGIVEIPELAAHPDLLTPINAEVERLWFQNTQG